MDWPTFQGLATIVGGIAGFVILTAAVGSAVTKLWQFPAVRVLVSPLTFPINATLDALEKRRNGSYVARTMPIVQTVVEQVVQNVVEAEVKKLMQPNGGNSVADVSAKVDYLTECLDRLVVDFESHKESSYRKWEQLEEQIAQLVDRTG